MNTVMDPDLSAGLGTLIFLLLLALLAAVLGLRHARHEPARSPLWGTVEEGGPWFQCRRGCQRYFRASPTGRYIGRAKSVDWR